MCERERRRERGRENVCVRVREKEGEREIEIEREAREGDRNMREWPLNVTFSRFAFRWQQLFMSR